MSAQKSPQTGPHASSKTSPQFERVALIGLGLIGSSLSHAIRRGGLAKDHALEQ